MRSSPSPRAGPLRSRGVDTFFIPYFFSDPLVELPNAAEATGILQKYGDLLDGFFLFVAAGLPVAMALSRLASSVLYRVSPFDAVSFLLAPSVFLLTSAAASYLTAHRVSAISLWEAMR